MKNYGSEGWYECKHCGEEYFQFSCMNLPSCNKCKDNPLMDKVEMEYKYNYRERPAGSHNPTHFEILAYKKDGNGCCKGSFPVLFDDLYMARRFCEVMNGE
jgi:hypothetical protein